MNDNPILDEIPESSCDWEGMYDRLKFKYDTLKTERDELLKSLKLAENLFFGLGGTVSRYEMGIIRKSIEMAEKGGKR